MPINLRKFILLQGYNALFSLHPHNKIKNCNLNIHSNLPASILRQFRIDISFQLRDWE